MTDAGNALSRWCLITAIAAIGMKTRLGELAKVSASVGYANANPAAQAFMDPELVNNPEVYPSQAVLDKLYISTTPTPATMRLMTRAWSKVKTNK